jgi:dethiobiotin synthetase
LLTEPLSPHRAAELEGVEIDAESLVLPAETQSGRPVIIEGAGGLMVPLTRRILYIEVFQRWRVPVVLCARTALGTINHSLLSVEALCTRGIPIVGIVFVGNSQTDSQRTICDFANLNCLGRLPWLPELTPEALAGAFASHFDPEPFRAALGR